MKLPDFFRNQLPEQIQRMADHPDYAPLGEYTENSRCMIQYTYPVQARDNTPSSTVLATVDSPTLLDPPVPGALVDLYGQQVEVDQVETDTEPHESGQGVFTLYTVTLRLPSPDAERG